MRTVRWLLAVLVCVGVAGLADGVALGAGLFRSVPEHRGDRTLVGAEGVARFRFVAVDFAQLSTGLGAGRFVPPNRLTLNLFPEVTVRAELERAGQGDSGARLWVGRLAAPARGEVILAFDERTLSGTVTVDGTVYQIRNGGDSAHVIRELSQGKSRQLVPLIASASSERAAERQLFQLVNHEREILGLRPYDWSDTLAQAARRHSQDMGRFGFFDHQNHNGEEAGERMREAGYDWRMSGENIAAGQERAIEVLEAWMNSPGHRRNLLRTGNSGDGLYFRDAGVGYVIVRNANYGHYWTLKLATP